MSEENLKAKEESKPQINFIEQFIADDIRNGKNGGEIGRAHV